ncbi:hypothetical protein UVI_02024600 [Ustilaginoidea virens]|nr:hypothetical protein UVI_02024600 [Ustilaginoidea virens]
MADDQSSSSKEDFADDQPINAPTPERPDKSLWYFLKTNGYPLFCLVGIVSVGVPLEVKFRDSRAMDGFALWMCWIISVRLQRMMKSAYFLTANMRYRHTLSTMINPVLATTMLMLGYTRLRGAIQQFEGGISKVLGGFSSGTPLYSIWAALVMPSTMPDNPSRWFGAGDFALSLLECGIVTWGFKLYECRRQLFSHAGVCIALFSSIAAAGNVFLSVLLAGILGLEAPEALSFAARSTTLALAKPAVKTLGGNLALNATLVVSNGILGQLLYPFLLDKLNVPVSSQDGPDTDKQKDGKDDGDSCTTVAAGAAIGINGAAMGVSYLYEVKSRAAPYAALSMTLFGVMTVVFTTLEPFKGLVLRLAAR